MPEPTLLAVSHGTSSPTGAAAVEALVGAVRARLTAPVAAGFVDVQQPDVPTCLARLHAAAPGDPVVVVPLLLSAGYHVHVDLRDAVDTAGAHVTLAGALGPDDRLVAVLARRLAEAGLRPADRVVLAAAGSSDARALADCEAIASRLAAVLGRPVTPAYISAAAPRLPDAVAAARAGGARVVVSTYLLAPGYFADLAAQAGADMTTAPLLPADGPVPDELVEVVLDRYTAAVRLSR